MRFRLLFSPEAAQVISELAQNDPKKHRRVLKTLALMEVNLRDPGSTEITVLAITPHP
ncbi:MAG: hypothetical protein HC827_10575 [Cyanobacteria bacterium RM1_2_2]|nr:hypothetical protein [Cyanobacteria bacterium RM1_2_2]